MSKNSLLTQSPSNTLKLSLKQILEKLFGDEDLNRNEHIQYVVNLLASQKTDEYLYGLNLDLFNFDLQENVTTLKLRPLVSSRKNKVLEAPITWYVNSIAQLEHPERNILIWNILVLKAAIYLIALPDLYPKLYQNKENFSEHLNTIKRLFQRFRAANRILNPNKKYKNTEKYMNLWNHYLNDPTLSLEEFVEFLKDHDNQNDTNTFENNLLNDLRVTFTYVLKNKAKITKVSTETKLQHQFLDEDELILESSEVFKGSKPKSLNIEKQLDDQDIRQIHVDPLTITPLAKNSETIQSYLLPLVSKHIQRKEHLLPFSSLYPNKTTTCALLSKLYDDFTQNKKRNVSLILMLSFLTGNTTKEWLKLQNKRVKSLNSRQKVIKINGKCFLRSKFSIFENKNFSYPNALLNHLIYLDIPIPNLFITSLQESNLVSEKELNEHLAKLRLELYVPKLSLIKISSLLHQSILHRTGNRQLADLLTGVDANKSSSISYCHQSIPTLQLQYLSFLKSLCEPLSNAYPDIESSSTLNFGSRKAPTPNMIKRIFTVLKTKIFIQDEHNLVAVYNHYNIWMWHFLLLFTAARPVSEFPGFLKSFNLKRKIFMVSDKEIGGRHDYGRLIPLSPFVVEEIQKFLHFLDYFKLQIGPSYPEIQYQIQLILVNKLPLLNIFHNEKWQTLSPSTVRNFTPELDLEHANWHRHAARAFLSNKISETEILALFGHEQMQQEAAHPYSSLSITQYSKISLILEQMKDHFQITGIELNALI